MALGLLPATAFSQVVLADFTTPPVAVNHPEGAGVDGTWYDVSQNAFGTITASTLDGNPAAEVVDGGFTNGVYIIYGGVVPATGNYNVSVRMHINEDPAQLDSIKAYQIGVTVNGVHRGLNPSKIAACPIVGNYAGLDATDNSALPTQTVVTSTFAATSGDNLLIAFSTACDSDYAANAGDFGAAADILVDTITLNPAAAVGNWELY